MNESVIINTNLPSGEHRAALTLSSRPVCTSCALNSLIGQFPIDYSISSIHGNCRSHNTVRLPYLALFTRAMFSEMYFTNEITVYSALVHRML